MKFINQHLVNSSDDSRGRPRLQSVGSSQFLFVKLIFLGLLFSGNKIKRFKYFNFFDLIWKKV